MDTVHKLNINWGMTLGAWMRGVIQLFTENPNFAGEGLRFLVYTFGWFQLRRYPTRYLCIRFGICQFRLAVVQWHWLIWHLSFHPWSKSWVSTLILERLGKACSPGVVSGIPLVGALEVCRSSSTSHCGWDCFLCRILLSCWLLFGSLLCLCCNLLVQSGSYFCPS